MTADGESSIIVHKDYYFGQVDIIRSLPYIHVLFYVNVNKADLNF